MKKKMEKQDTAPPTTSSTATTASTHELFVRRRNGKWIVTGEREDTPIRVYRKDKIRWTVEGDALVAFQFPYLYLFEEACGKQQWKWFASPSKSLTLTVMEDAPLGEHTYAAFCLLLVGADDLQERVEQGEIGYAEGGSPPRIIIMQ